MGKSCKIEKLGLSETVQGLMAEGVTTRAEMTERLQQEYGADVSEATVGRYMARIRGAAANEAFQKITDHVNRTVPNDLEALEEMEKQALEWSREAGASQTERAAAAAEQIRGELAEWRHELIQEKEDHAPVVRRIIKKCLSYIQADDRRQEQRLAAMRMVHKIIETKLAKAGLLDDEQKGRIVFLKREAEGNNGDGPADEKRSGRVIRLVEGAGGDDESGRS